MQRTHRIAGVAVTLAAVTVGSLGLASPAAAKEVSAPRPVTATTVPTSPTPAMPTGDDNPITQASSGWTGGTEQGEDGKWIAYIEPRGGFVRLEVGSYETKREARRAAKKAADEANGVMADPACDNPIIVC